MQKLINKIKDKYYEYLTEEEKRILDDCTEIKLREIINNIWNKYLSKDYEIGNQFKYIETFLSPALLAYIDENMELYEVLNLNNKSFNIITSDNLKDSYNGKMGFICEIDWTKTDKLYLPCDFTKDLYLTKGITIKAIYVINIGEDILNAEVELGKYYAELIGIPYYNFNKELYDSINKTDYNKIALYIVSDYTLKFYQKPEIDKKDELYKKYKSYIIEKYLELKDKISNEEFRELMFDYLKKQEKSNYLKRK